MTIQRRRLLRVGLACSVLGVAGCVSTGSLGSAPKKDESDGDEDADGDGDDGDEAIGDSELILATTTSTYDTGLLEVINSEFESRYDVRVKTISKGTGASIRTARDGDADVILVHARSAEDAFLREGYGVNRRDVMYNDFVVVGPPADPAGIGDATTATGANTATGAFAAIAEAESTFVSRGDDSGTNSRELSIWEAAGIGPSGTWYREIGKGMGDTLVHADQTGAYTIADRGTFLSMADEIDLEILVQGPIEGGPALLKNSYGIILVNPGRHADVNYQAAMAYVGFLTSPAGQSIIENYTTNGSHLFYPNAISAEPNFTQYVPGDYDREESGRMTPDRVASTAASMVLGDPDGVSTQRVNPDATGVDER